MKIAIFGGSFNPPHNMHFNIAQELIRLNYVNKVIFVPTGNRYSKPDLLDSKYRLDMLKIICRKSDKLIVSDFETQNNFVYTYETLDYFKSIYPDDEIFFVLGTDNLVELKTWKKSDYLLSQFKFLVIKREGQNIDEVINSFGKYGNNIIVTTIPMVNISSTIIRKMLKENKDDVHIFLDDKVIKYIYKNNLYI